MTGFNTHGLVLSPEASATLPEPAPPGVVAERWNAYQAAKTLAPRNALPGDLLALAAFLGALDREEAFEEPGDIDGNLEPEDDRPDPEPVTATDEDDDDETPGFTPADGGDEWPPVRLAGETWPRWERRVYALFRAGKAPEEYYQ